MSAFPKPSEAEGKITLSPAQRVEKRRELFNAQGGICAECGRAMVWEMGFMNSCTLDHIVPQPAGAKKRDNPDNLRAICWSDNFVKGSKRK